MYLLALEALLTRKVYSPAVSPIRSEYCRLRPSKLECASFAYHAAGCISVRACCCKISYCIRRYTHRRLPAQTSCGAGRRLCVCVCKRFLSLVAASWPRSQCWAALPTDVSTRSPPSAAGYIATVTKRVSLACRCCWMVKSASQWGSGHCEDATR